jgi:single-stranded DNA-specific DHH superfamily exonuclease
MNKRLLKKILDFLKSISKEDKVAVMHHTDPDGVCSGVIMTKAIERLRKKKIDLRVNQGSTAHTISDETIKKLKKKNINKFITTDLAVDGGKKQLLKVAQFAQVLIIDHHTLFPVQHKNIIIVKPQNLINDKKPSQYPATKFCYDIVKKIVNVQDLDWLVGLGILMDGAQKRWPLFIHNLFKKYNVKKQKNMYHTVFGKAGIMLHFSELYSIRNVPTCYTIIYNAKNPQTILNSPLKKYDKAVRKEVRYWMEQVNNKAEFHNNCDLIYYELPPKYKVQGPVSTLLSRKHPHKTIITISRNKKKVYISARRQDWKVPVNQLIINVLKPLKHSQGGGHVPAAGGQFLRKDLALFKKRLLTALCK